jgi:hypothetical protein
MRKLVLDLDSLVVQSFETTSADDLARGTVLGRGAIVGGDINRGTYPNGCPSPLCVDTPLASCDGSCGNSCYDSCKASCGGSCIYSCAASCGGTCDGTCYDSCKPSCGPLCIPPTDPAIG